MRKILAATGLAALLGLAAVQPAAAATAVGNGCVGSAAAPGTIVSLANGPGESLPATVPAGGVITSWKVKVAGMPPASTAVHSLRILRPTGQPKEFRVVGESATVILQNGEQTHATRIPVLGGDHLSAGFAINADVGSLMCETKNPGDRLGLMPGTPPVGGTGTIAQEETGWQVPITVFVEPDADNDGFGDQTQDKCPQRADTQADCPPPPPPSPVTPLVGPPRVALDSVSMATKGGVIVYVAVSHEAPVTVGGTVTLGKGKTATLSGGTQTVRPGSLLPFTLKFPQALKAKLKALPPKRKLTVSIAAKATNGSGEVTTDDMSLKLPGQKKGPRRR